MTKLIILIIIAIIGVIAYVSKKTASAIANKKSLQDATVKSETKNLMDNTAKGINWLNEQWEKSKKSATSDVITCPKCKQKLRIPKNVNLEVTCTNPKCKEVFNHTGKK